MIVQAYIAWGVHDDTSSAIAQRMQDMSHPIEVNMHSARYTAHTSCVP